VTRRAVRTVLSSMLQMAWDEGYRDDNPLRTITLNKVPAKPVLVSSHAQWNRLEEVLPFHAALVYAPSCAVAERSGGLKLNAQAGRPRQPTQPELLTWCMARFAGSAVISVRPLARCR
jgi:hypothetical protein